MFLFSAFDTYVVKVLGEDTQKKNADDLNIILHSASYNKVRTTHVASMSA
jgi:hypothetical protein